MKATMPAIKPELRDYVLQQPPAAEDVILANVARWADKERARKAQLSLKGKKGG